MSKVKDLLYLICLGLLAFILLVIALHIHGWARALDASFVHFDKLVGEASIAAKNVAASSQSAKESSDTVNKQVPTILNQMSSSITKFNTLLDSSNGTVKAANTLIITGSRTISDAGLDVRHIAENADLLMNHANGAIDSVPPTLESARKLMGSASLFIDLPLTKTTDDLDKLLVPSGLLVTDVQTKTHAWLYPQPYKGRFRTLHNAWQLTKGVLQFSEPTYYITNTVRSK